MVRDTKVAPAAHQPSKTELEEDIGVDASPEALAWAVTRGGGVPRREPETGNENGCGCLDGISEK